ncbi:MAG: deaminase, partial [Balneolaceae bacterium]|nr:deaminase [Balneolaceae bacterium]
MSEDNNLPLIEQHQKFMLKAFKLAEDAYEEGEIPVGALIVQGDRIVGKGYNQ